ncbi:hypothetical protein BRADI_1g65030v3 [Brachypodium distachyon]|uniref:Late embryogenesis abundant protein LEA-2 subgroup domain-containing protein n=1 Tax=Brachypodium distachyon TaxID=15368 RepID=I1H6E2_BRADI|nr:hypothetical protein BRADI_1g65030v3 [Brachypodium distachyon]
MAPSTRPRRRDSFREDLKGGAFSLYTNLWIWGIFFYVTYFYKNLPPKFSLELTEEASSRSLQTAAPAAFNVTLHAANRKRADRCYRHGEAAVLYSGFTVAWGRTPRFCVDARGVRAVTFVAWADDELPRLLRDRMAADRRSEGSVELDVDVRLFRGDDRSSTPTWMRCKVMMTGAGAECTVFALQNWASDVAPFWMEM